MRVELIMTARALLVAHSCPHTVTRRAIYSVLVDDSPLQLSIVEVLLVVGGGDGAALNCGRRRRRLGHIELNGIGITRRLDITLALATAAATTSCAICVR